MAENLTVKTTNDYEVSLSFNNGDGEEKWLNITLKSEDVVDIKGYFKKHMVSDILNVTIHKIVSK